MPHAGTWWLYLHSTDTRNAARRIYAAYKQQGLVRVTGIPYFKDEVILFDLEDCLHCHRNEGDNPGGAGDILFPRQTQFYSGDGPGLGPDSHGRWMSGRGEGHNRTRELVDNTPMVSSPAVMDCARRVVDFVEHYAPDHLMDW
jgi:hypothetical protein